MDTAKPLTIFDPNQPWKQMTLTDFTQRELLQPIYVGGKRVYESPELMEIQAYAKHDLATFWDEYRRLTMPHRYKVDLSDELYTLKQNLLRRQGQWK